MKILYLLSLISFLLPNYILPAQIKVAAESQVLTHTLHSIALQDALPVPKALQNNRLIYLRVQTQGTDECGYRSVYNARAINELLNNNETITTSKINEKSNALIESLGIENKQMSAEVLHNYAHSLGLENVYICQARPAEKVAAICLGPDNDTKGQKMIETLQNKDSHSRFFIFCNYANHWVNVIVKK